VNLSATLPLPGIGSLISRIHALATGTTSAKRSARSPLVLRVPLCLVSSAHSETDPIGSEDVAPVGSEEPKGKPPEEGNAAPSSQTDAPSQTKAISFQAVIRKPVSQALGTTPYQTERLLEILDQVYADRSTPRIWAKNTSPPRLKSVVTGVLVEHGFADSGILNPADLRKRWQAIDLPVPSADLAASVAVIDAGMRLHEGTIDPSQLWKHWQRGDTPGSVEWSGMKARIDGAFRDDASFLSPKDARDILEAFAPSNWIYRRLLDTWRREIGKDATGAPESFVPLPPEPEIVSIEEGAEYEHAESLATLLRLDNVFQGAQSGPEISADLANSFRAFQEKHHLKEDGLLGPHSRGILNETPQARRQRLWLNLHRARLLPNELGTRYVLVNLPSGQVFGFTNQVPEIRMKVVFGKNSPGRQTPIFREVMRYVVFRPYWNVPRSIAANEIYPAAIRDRSYMSRKGYELVRSFGGDAQRIRVSWRSLEALREGHLKVRQIPGPRNSLGVVKFLFPNDHSVYLHDTPQDHLFSRSERDFSHGCIRLEKPARFAEWALGPQGWDEDRVAQAMRAGNRQSVSIETAIPVYITYLTVFPSSKQGQVKRFFDIYGRDEPALEAISENLSKPIPGIGETL